MGVTRGWQAVPVAANSYVSNVSALIVRRSMYVTDDERPRTYVDLERFVSSDDPIVHLLARTVQEQASVIRELAENARDVRRPKRKRMDKRVREIARDVIQAELFERAAPTVTRKSRAKGHLFYSRTEFDTRLRAAIAEIWDPQNFQKLTVASVLTHLHIASANTLSGMLEDYGYTRPHETLSKCLHRLADEWHPEWRGINRQRF